MEFRLHGCGLVSLTHALFKSQLDYLFNNQIKVDPILSFLQLDYQKFPPSAGVLGTQEDERRRWSLPVSDEAPVVPAAIQVNLVKPAPSFRRLLSQLRGVIKAELISLLWSLLFGLIGVSGSWILLFLEEGEHGDVRAVLKGWGGGQEQLA